MDAGTTRSPVRPRASRFVRAFVAVALFAAGAGAFSWRACGREREIASLAPEARRELYERTMQTLRGACSDPPGLEVARHCRDEAEFVASFPECDEACRGLVARFATKATR